jgi:hypothetical protein
MHIDTMRRIDLWAGIPLTFLLTLVLRVVELLSPTQKRQPPRRVLCVELSEMGSTIWPIQPCANCAVNSAASCTLPSLPVTGPAWIYPYYQEFHCVGQYTYGGAGGIALFQTYIGDEEIVLPCVSATNHSKTSCTDNACLKAISVDQVFTAVQPLLQTKP